MYTLGTGFIGDVGHNGVKPPENTRHMWRKTQQIGISGALERLENANLSLRSKGSRVRVAPGAPEPLHVADSRKGPLYLAV